MLRPKDLAPTDYTEALKPTLGYEQQVYVATHARVELGMLEVTGANSRVYTRRVADNAVALKPTFGYEQQLYVSTHASVELGMLEVTAPNSGVYTPSVADNAALSGVPLESLAELESDVNCGNSDLVVTVTGTDALD